VLKALEVSLSLEAWLYVSVRLGSGQRGCQPAAPGRGAADRRNTAGSTFLLGGCFKSPQISARSGYFV